MAREMAIQMLYQHDVGKTALTEVFASFDLSSYLAGPEEREAFARRRGNVDGAFQYARSLVSGAAENRSEIDQLIRQQADNWRLERMPVVDRNILRLAIYEMLFEKEIPKLVVVDEAIELAKKFGSDQSSRFINGLLDGFLKQPAARRGP